ncbi:TRAF3-interacting protein 1 [Plutella xylostella]|uniref:TRAF3-interacting protein 1 n=1 Tax=Plutella xylostella TaxID=51655 RepID=UPI0020330CAA|nr:TRAF3-interacting protein 1 [Plutella xylostella]
MEKELDQEIIKATQNALGKYVKRPPLSEKLLKKPPFRFLHDIVTSVLKSTGFFEGLFDESELVSDNVKDRETKILFLNKVITVVGLTTGQPLSVKPSKIVAGQEADKTNELLQSIAYALDNKLTSHDAVKKFKDGTTKTEKSEKKGKDTTKTVKKNEESKLTLKKTDNSKSIQKDVNNEKSTKAKNEKSVTNSTKSKTTKVEKANDKLTVKKESLPKPSSKQVKVNKLGKSNKDGVDGIDKQNSNENSKNKVDHEESETITNKIELEISEKNGVMEEDLNKEREGVDAPLNSSYVIAENDINSSLSSQDLMEPDLKAVESKDIANDSKKQTDYNDSQEPKEAVDANSYEATSKNLNDELVQDLKVKPQPIKLIKDVKSSSLDEAPNVKPSEKSGVVSRPQSVRPSSSRPGAPRLREKHDYVLNGNENLIVGKVNIIQENMSIDEEDDSSIIIVDPKADAAPEESLQMSSNQHGHLVQQILDSTKEFSQSTGKTEIEWQFDALKAKEASSQEIEQLRFNIQALSRIANPLGKLLDHIQEDVEVMRQELQQWTKTYEDAAKELSKQKMANEESLHPLHTRVKQLDMDIKEKHEKINDLRVIIHKNTTRINKLIANGNVQ